MVFSQDMVNRLRKCFKALNTRADNHFVGYYERGNEIVLYFTYEVDGSDWEAIKDAFYKSGYLFSSIDFDENNLYFHFSNAGGIEVEIYNKASAPSKIPPKYIDTSSIRAIHRSIDSDNSKFFVEYYGYYGSPNAHDFLSVESFMAKHGYFVSYIRLSDYNIIKVVYS